MRGRGAPKRAGPGYIGYKLHPQLEKSSIHNSRGHFLSADGSDTVCIRLAGSCILHVMKLINYFQARCYHLHTIHINTHKASKCKNYLN